MRYFSSYSIFSRIVGILLFGAGFSKAFFFANPAIYDTGLLATHGQVERIAIASFEIVLSLWIFVGLQPLATRRIILLTFALFLIFNLCYIVAGKRSCLCFGVQSVKPWVSATMDGLVLVTIALVPPKVTMDEAPTSYRLRLFGFVSVSLMFVVCVAAAAYPTSEKAEVLPGSINWGVLPPGTIRYATCQVRNTGRIPLSLSHVESSCECLRLTLQAQTLNPGEEAKLELDLRLDDKRYFTGDLRILIRGFTKDGILAFTLPVEFSICEESATGE